MGAWPAARTTACCARGPCGFASRPSEGGPHRAPGGLESVLDALVIVDPRCQGGSCGAGSPGSRASPWLAERVAGTAERGRPGLARLQRMLRGGAAQRRAGGRTLPGGELGGTVGRAMGCSLVGVVLRGRRQQIMRQSGLVLVTLRVWVCGEVRSWRAGNLRVACGNADLLP